MKTNPTLEKLVSLLGRSEHDPEVIAVLTELGEKLPLKRPKSYDNGGYLLEDNKKKNRGYHIGVKYAANLAVNDGNANFKEKELALYNIQGISNKEKFKDTIFPFGIAWKMSLDQALKLFGKETGFDKLSNGCTNYYWLKNHIMISLDFDQDNILQEILYYTPLKED